MFKRIKILLLQIVKYLPFDSQLQQAQEELTELNLAISKYRRKSRKYSLPIQDSWESVLTNLKEEIADVMIMLFQLIIYFDCEEDIEEIVNSKLQRTISKLREYDD